ncbi:hypothetical protein B0O99DRAFT_688766 [Bisporella sp. PMI_857]|nr:hypothetical protein B0O99DRAFT_688766 [Bisporella sp. PMI_857]
MSPTVATIFSSAVYATRNTSTEQFTSIECPKRLSGLDSFGIFVGVLILAVILISFNRNCATRNLIKKLHETPAHQLHEAVSVMWQNYGTSQRRDYRTITFRDHPESRTRKIEILLDWSQIPDHDGAARHGTQHDDVGRVLPHTPMQRDAGGTPPPPYNAVDELDVGDAERPTVVDVGRFRFGEGRRM